MVGSFFRKRRRTEMQRFVLRITPILRLFSILISKTSNLENLQQLQQDDWLPTDKRLDTGDPPGISLSAYPKINCSGNNISVLWGDAKNG
jgi:hypothetical protein